MTTPSSLDSGFSLAHYWAQGDAVSHLVAYLLLAMSIASWCYIIAKSWSGWRIRRSVGVLERFWQAPTMGDALAMIRHGDPEGVYAPLALQSAAAAALSSPSGAAAGSGFAPRPTSGPASEPATSPSNPPPTSLKAGFDPGELITLTLRQEINRVSLRLERGLTLLASVGATAPFVGLLGTVWGIYHALAAVSAAGTVTIDQVAGPVGEALVMTAFGLVVAIPAVLAYNAFIRVNRITLAELDGFAHDLHAYLTTGARVQAAGAGR